VKELVNGAGGFIGSHLVEHFLPAGYGALHWRCARSYVVTNVSGALNVCWAALD
jgi:FlaA1/EpsC-like NDP-sugar epimerase